MRVNKQIFIIISVVMQWCYTYCGTQQFQAQQKIFNVREIIFKGRKCDKNALFQKRMSGTKCY